MLAHLRCGRTYAQLAAGFGIGVATAYRYVTEAVVILAALAPDIEAVVKTAARKAFVILDETLLPIDRIAADRPYYSGKHKKHGMNVRVIADPFGNLLWASPALPGAVHDIKAARTHGTIGALAEAGVRCWADKAYQGAGVPCVCPTAAAGRSCPRASRHATGPTPRSARSANRPWPPSRPGGSYANCGAAPPASPTWSGPSSPFTSPPTS